MKNTNKPKLDLEFLFSIVVVLLIVGYVLFYIIMLIKYANTPVGEIPLWILWLLFKQNK